MIQFLFPINISQQKNKKQRLSSWFMMNFRNDTGKELAE